MDKIEFFAKNPVKTLRFTARYLRNLGTHTARKAGVLKIRYRTIETSAGIKFKVRELKDNWDERIIREVWDHDIYKIRDLDLGQSPVVVDLGANIGAFSILAATKWNAKVYSFEPHPDNFKLLTENIKLNQDKLKGVINPENKAVSNCEGKLKLYADRDNFAASSLNKPLGAGIEVECWNLEKFFERERIGHCDLLKIDVEGAEYEILLNLSKKTLEKVERIVLEYHNVPFKNDVYNYHSLTRLLEESGFETERWEPIISAHKRR